MTAYVLVSDSFTGGWIWQEVADRLRESGAEVHPVTLTGMGDRREPAGPGTDLETHIEDVIRQIDAVAVPELVIVGHGYGIHPVLGAADRRADRIGRIVFLDAGMPQDGDLALALVPDQAAREFLLNPAEEGRPVPAPSGGGWQRWGSIVGLAPEALERMDRLAAPQPAGTLTRPLRLSGAVSALPTTGVFCTANGMSIEMVEFLVKSGPPQFKALADPKVSFFDLDTGHWPMLSCPDELAEVLRRAAAGEGHRVTAPENGPHSFLGPFPLDVPECPRERIGRVDLHLPAGLSGADEPRPAVVFIHGGPLPADMQPGPLDFPVFVGYGRYAASLGAVGVTLEHRLHALTDYARAAEDLAAAIELVRADPRVDADRVALWFFSGGGLLSADWFASRPSWLRCVAANYPVLAPLASWLQVDSRFRPADAVSAAGDLPIVLTRAGRENPEVAVTIEKFLAAATERGAELEVIDVPNGHHGFETVDPADESREAIQRAMRSVIGHLRGQPGRTS